MNYIVSTTSPCKWYGITCNNEGNVAELNVTGFGLQGTLNNFNFSYFQTFGSIPRETGKLTSLTLLSLSNNNLKGSIPTSLTNLTSLAFLRLNNNRLSSIIP
ncbi:leucine-rich repeat protein 1-like [Papaver somniferum]|uniref:leucine-rich repeat protein 1-like n=1 Tax=Papaver somniferum TaxID=3469 RepID=UPI000E6F46B6|nr:leucine-rich repeat protein 1-like [Papaver somniferum]